jgi:hypothetical protein
VHDRELMPEPRVRVGLCPISSGTLALGAVADPQAQKVLFLDWTTEGPRVREI